jgi:hypothetical protein
LSFREQFRIPYFLFEDCGDLEENKIIIHVLIDVRYCSFTSPGTTPPIIHGMEITAFVLKITSIEKKGDCKELT